MSWGKKGHGGGGGHDGAGGMRWLLTYADLITLLLVFFIICYASAAQDAVKMSLVSASLAAAFRPFESDLSSPFPGAGKRDGIRTSGAAPTDTTQSLIDEMSEAFRLLDAEPTIRYMSGSLYVDIPLTSVIDDNGTGIRDSAHPFLMRIANFLRYLPNQTEVIAYHRSAPPDGVDVWTLTTRQAMIVARHLVEQGGVDPMKISSAGKGSYPPRAGEAGAPMPLDGITVAIFQEDRSRGVPGRGR